MTNSTKRVGAMMLSSVYLQGLEIECREGHIGTSFCVFLGRAILCIFMAFRSISRLKSII